LRAEPTPTIFAVGLVRVDLAVSVVGPAARVKDDVLERAVGIDGWIVRKQAWPGRQRAGGIRIQHLAIGVLPSRKYDRLRLVGIGRAG